MIRITSLENPKKNFFRYSEKRVVIIRPFTAKSCCSYLMFNAQDDNLTRNVSNFLHMPTIYLRPRKRCCPFCYRVADPGGAHVDAQNKFFFLVFSSWKTIYHSKSAKLIVSIENKFELFFNQNKSFIRWILAKASCLPSSVLLSRRPTVYKN
jgi:hypothetical protein